MNSTAYGGSVSLRIGALTYGIAGVKTIPSANLTARSPVVRADFHFRLCDVCTPANRSQTSLAVESAISLELKWVARRRGSIIS